jgi:hypothetical protein
MTDGPFQGAFEADTTGVVRREITTYRYKNGMLVKETATRTYYKNGDYNDSTASIPMQEIINA